MLMETVWMALTLVCGLVPLAQAQPAPGAARPVVDLQGDVRITEPVTWRGAHYRLHGSLILAAGGVLTAEDCTIELMNTYTRQYRFLWEGGTLVTRHCTVGGSDANGTVCQCNFELWDGLWDATDTTVRQSSGIIFGETETVGRLRATRLVAGPNPDSIIMTGRGDVALKDSTFAISLTVYAGRGVTRGVFDLPVNEPVTGVYDSTNMPGAAYRLEMVNSTVPLWFLFANCVTMDGPPTELVLRNCPFLIPSVLGWNLKGEISLPAPWPGEQRNASLRVGNLTWHTLDKPAGIYCWGLYLSGDETDVTVRGQTLICELMVGGGKVVVEGAPGTFEAATTATTIEVGATGTDKPAELVLRNASIGRPVGDPVRGQVTAHGAARVLIENSRYTDLRLMTKDTGEIAARDLTPEGELELRGNGGPIRLLPPSRKP
jgi:hypothetical protein